MQCTYFTTASIYTYEHAHNCYAKQKPCDTKSIWNRGFFSIFFFTQIQTIFNDLFNWRKYMFSKQETISKCSLVTYYVSPCTPHYTLNSLIASKWMGMENKWRNESKSDVSIKRNEREHLNRHQIIFLRLGIFSLLFFFFAFSSALLFRLHF